MYDKDAWAKLGQLLLLKNKQKIYNHEIEDQDVVKGFKELYKADMNYSKTEDRKIEELMSILIKIWGYCKANEQFFRVLGPTKLPYSNALDINGYG